MFPFYMDAHPLRFARFTISLLMGSQRIWFSQILRFVWGIGGYVVHISPSRWSQGAGLICALAEFLDLKEQFHQLILEANAELFRGSSMIVKNVSH